MSAIIRDKSGQKLAIVLLSPPEDEQTIPIQRVIEGKGSLLHYYFGRGMREVTIESETFRLPGVLRTNWAKNERKWRVALDPAAPRFVPEPVEPASAESRLASVGT